MITDKGVGAQRGQRARNAVEAFKCAATTLGTVGPGFSLFGITRGQFSMIDLILACLEQVGPSRLSLWTWCIADYEVQCFERLMMENKVSGALLVIDSAARQKNRELLQKWQEKHGPESIRWVVNHAKLATIESAGGLKLLLRGSMNLNYNPRFEQFDVDEGHPGFDLVRGIEGGLPILKFDHPNGEARTATNIDKAFDQAGDKARLKPFEVRKIWAK